MFLHELGHHKYGIKDIDTREINAEKYMMASLTKLYGKWIYFFDFLAGIDQICKKTNNKTCYPNNNK